MRKFVKKMSKTAALAPGTLVHIGDIQSGPVQIHVIDYDDISFQERGVKTPEECFSFKESPTITWINIDGIHDTATIEKIGGRFGIHPLILEDIVNTAQRPKTEDFEKYIYVTLKMISFDAASEQLDIEHVSIIVSDNFVITFQEKPGDVFDAVRERIRSGKGKIRKMGSDYLAYSLIDAIVDNYFIVLEKFGEKVEMLEEKLVSNPVPATLRTIHELKRNTLFLRKSVWPLREVISGLQRGGSLLFKDSTQVYLRDVYDHTIQVIDTIETLRDMASGMLDIYLSSISNRMNEVMKVLTIFAAIFIPLTFIAGIYGMNFEYMPELKWHGGYFGALTLMAGVAVVMLGYFKRKKWL